MLSMARPASFPRQQLAVEFRAFLRRRRRHVLSLVAIEVGLTALLSVVLLVFWHRGPALWYVLGGLHMLLICAVPAAIGLAFLANSRTAIWNLRGAMGESNTSEVLQSARKQKVVWGYVESVAVTGDIDHLVVTRAGGVLAIDSKWRNDVTADMLTSDAAAARAAARRAESILRSEHVGTLKREARARHRGRWRIVLRHAGRGDLGCRPSRDARQRNAGRRGVRPRREAGCMAHSPQ